MIRKLNSIYKQLKSEIKINSPWDLIIIFVLNILIAIPVFLIAHQNLVDFNWYFNLDRIILFLGILISIQLVLQAMRKIILIAIFIYLFALIYGTVFGSYGFGNVFEDYRSMM